MSGIGAPVARLEGRDKVTGTARYAYEHNPQDRLYAWPVQSTVGSGKISAIHTLAAMSHPGVRDVITHATAPRLNDAGDAELLVLQSPEVAYRGQVVALVIAESAETAREGAALVSVTYDAHAPDAVLTTDHSRLYAPKTDNGGFATDSQHGDIDDALATAAMTVDQTYSTPAQFNNPMETHSSMAHWSDGRLEIEESSQGAGAFKKSVATLFAIDPSKVRVRSEHVGGGFGGKGSARPNIVLAVMAALVTGRPVKVTYTRQMMFALAGYRTPTVSRIRLAAGEDGVLTGISHDAFSQTSTIEEFAEQIAESTRHLYAAENRSTTHRVAALDVPTPRWMRAPGECPGVYALESAMDELAEVAGIDPIELRVRNEPTVDPETGLEFSSRHLVECLRRGAEVFGWAERDSRPGVRVEGRWMFGTGVSAAIYPTLIPPSTARVTARLDGRFDVDIDATDIGTGARTVIGQIAADALGVQPEDVSVHIGDSALPTAYIAGGSGGTSSWGWAVTKACALLAVRLAGGADIPEDGLVVDADTTDDIKAMKDLDRHAYGAQFAEVRVDRDSGEVAVTRMLGVFAVGRIMNGRTARSQLIGGMTMGISMALHEQGVIDAVHGDYLNHDFGSYHIAANADVPAIEVEWLDEDDTDIAPTRGKGIGEIGIVGAASAIGNAVWHATGQRVRDLPIQPDSIVAGLPVRW